MAKESRNLQFSKATITFEENENGVSVFVTEFLKETTNTYDLIEVLKQFENIDGLTITIKRDRELPSE